MHLQMVEIRTLKVVWAYYQYGSLLEGFCGKIATVSGRYYAMDRDKRWERVKLAYDGLVNTKGATATNAIEAVAASYVAGKTDEFLLPTVILNDKGAPVAKIQSGDYAICFNFRTDRCREITEVLTQTDYPEFEMKSLDLLILP